MKVRLWKNYPYSVTGTVTELGGATEDEIRAAVFAEAHIKDQPGHHFGANVEVKRAQDTATVKIFTD